MENFNAIQVCEDGNMSFSLHRSSGKLEEAKSSKRSSREEISEPPRKKSSFNHPINRIELSPTIFGAGTPIIAASKKILENLSARKIHNKVEPGAELSNS